MSNFDIWVWPALPQQHTQHSQNITFNILQRTTRDGLLLRTPEAYWIRKLQSRINRKMEDMGTLYQQSLLPSRVFGYSCHYFFYANKTFDCPVIVNGTGNSIMLSTSYYFYHYLLPNKAWHAPHTLARINSFVFKIYRLTAYGRDIMLVLTSTGGEIITTLWFIRYLTNTAYFKALVHVHVMFYYLFVPLKKLSGSENGLYRSYCWIVLIGLVNIKNNFHGKCRVHTRWVVYNIIDMGRPRSWWLAILMTMITCHIL